MLGKTDFARYPYVKEATDFVRQLGFNIEDFSKPELEQVIHRAKERVYNSIINRTVGDADDADEIEILSYPIAILIVKSIGDEYLRKRYAQAESRKASELLAEETPERILDIAKSFNWQIEWRTDAPGTPFTVNFVDYVRNTGRFTQPEWKLVNRKIRNGKVTISKDDAVTMFREEIRRHIETRLEGRPEAELPHTLESAVKVTNEFFVKNKRFLSAESEIESVNKSAFPPCMVNLYNGLSAGKNLPHMGRFTLTAFLLTAGTSEEDMVKMFTSASDFSERITRYQVQHIAGKTGGGTKYRPLNCASMKTHGLCVNPDALCETISSPLSYYRKKSRILKAGTNKKRWTQSTSYTANSETTISKT